MDANVQHGTRSPLLVKLAFIASKCKDASLLGNAKVHAAAACVQILYAGFQVLASAALSNGISRPIFLVYRNAIAALFVGVVAFFAERRIRPRLTFMKVCQLFLSGFIGICINQTLFLAGLHYTSATFAATLQNLTPALTFMIAVLLGIEKIRVRKMEDQAKALGVLIGVGGATLTAVYKGPSILPTAAKDAIISLLQRTSYPCIAIESSSYTMISMKLGVVCLLGNCATWATWFILQTPVLRDYPAPLSATAFTYTFGSIQLAIIATYIERDLNTWASTFYSQLPAVLYGGLVASGVAMTMQGWCAYRGGPVLIAAYQPLQTILVAILSSLFLQETFYLGSLIGGLFIIVGLYLVVWGNSRERRLINGRLVIEPSQKYITIPIQQDDSLHSTATLTEPLLVSIYPH